MAFRASPDCVRSGQDGPSAASTEGLNNKSEDVPQDSACVSLAVPTALEEELSKLHLSGHGPLSGLSIGHCQTRTGLRIGWKSWKQPALAFQSQGRETQNDSPGMQREKKRNVHIQPSRSEAHGS
ncbi:uncharacterized protein RCC_07979 [Ramularia collo-cygni]|uniref:Uncharacterized protein n=1 Tax=Ramularia collo-cygni TaxID=112498 RepID=A0A2D3V9J4_9PEZI|nr:uncharacterized protein RCC_07979 [Ramularia collo-cygni]CZT22110.1 uncharacterized protein RCC_07979 [Ramularia collo-cygni]